MPPFPPIPRSAVRSIGLQSPFHGPVPVDAIRGDFGKIECRSCCRPFLRLHCLPSLFLSGLLLAHKTIAERPWFIYLVGVVKNDQVQDLRLLALSALAGKTTWRVGERNAPAFKLYRDYALTQWRQHNGDRAKPPPPYTTFPRESDTFDVTIDGTLIRATHAASGAQFTVNLAPQAAAQPTSKRTKTRR